MLDEATAQLLQEANDAHAALAAEVRALGPLTADPRSTSRTNVLNWLANDPAYAGLLGAVERVITTRARLAMSLRMHHAEISKP